MPTQDVFQTKVDNKPYDTEDKRYLTTLDYIAFLGSWVVILISCFN